jgi:hypothetical protein
MRVFPLQAFGACVRLYDVSMPIVVFWIETDGVPAYCEFGDAELMQVLQLTEQLRAQGKRHVTISSDLAGSVGVPGVDELSGGRLPGGEPYEFKKRHRGGGPKA